MLSHKLSNLLKLYRMAQRAKNVNTIKHCSTEYKKVLVKIDGKLVDPVTCLYLKDLSVIDKECKQLLTAISVRHVAA